MIFGYELIIDIKDHKGVTRDLLKKFIIDLCKRIKMKRYGECKIVLFGKDRFRGYSLMQFITTSSIVGHFTDTEGYLNIFSCKEYDRHTVLKLVREVFKGRIKHRFIKR